MMLRASSQVTQQDYSLDAIATGEGDDSGIPLGAELVAFAEAIYSRDADAIAAARAALLEASDERTVVDAAGVAANFHRMTRVADASGIPMDERWVEESAPVRESLGLNEYGSAKNTLG